MKVKSYKRGVIEKEALCRDCEWRNYEINANVKGRYHSQKTGHTVDVYVTHQSTIVAK